ncbi:MAG: ATP-binding protein [Spirochaetaceae bacterium]
MRGIRKSSGRTGLILHYAVYVVILGVAILVTTLINARILRESTYDITRNDLHSLATMARNLLAPEVMRNPREAQRFCEQAAMETGTRITIIRRNGVVLGDSAADPETMENHQDRPEIRAALDGQEGVSLRYSETLGRVLMYAALPVTEQREIVGVMRVSLTAANIEALLVELYSRIAIATAALLVVTVLTTLAISRSILKPIRNLHAGARAYSEGELNHQIAVVGPKELRELAQAFQSMARQLRDRIRSLEGQRKETEELLNAIREPLVLLDEELRVQRLNMAAAHLAGLDSPEIIGRRLIEVFRSAALDEFARSVASSAVQEETTLVHYGARESRLNVWGLKLTSQGSLLQGHILLLMRDVSREQRVERIRRDFVSNVSHELKTPLTMIKGAVETLQDLSEESDETRSRFERMIESHTDRMIAIVEDLLSLARIEQSEASEVPFQKSRVRDLFDEAVSATEPLLRERSASVEIDAPEELTVNAHPHLLIQALTNLIDNGVKYSDPGGTVRLRGRRENGVIRLEVEDTGWGIPVRDQERVFERFYRVDRSRTRERGGTGLGLSIVRHVALMHGGTVSLKSTPGEGSTFSIQLPEGEL